MKMCFKCCKTLPLDEFYKHKQMGDGHLNKCKECTKKDVKGSNKSYCNIVWGDGKASAAWIKRNPLKRSAQNKLARAIRSGDLKKEPCEICGKSGAHAHHDDYRKPLDVRWLCPKHHAQIHKNLRMVAD